MPDVAGHIVDFGKGRIKFARFRLARGGKSHLVSTGTSSTAHAERFLSRLEVLVERRAQGDPVPPELLPWVRALPDSAAQKLASLNLIDARLREVDRTLEEHLADWQVIVATRDGNTSLHARRSAGYIRSLAKDLNWRTVTDIRGDAVLRELERRGHAAATMALYINAVRDFLRWCVDTKRMPRPVDDELPGNFGHVKAPNPVPTFDRRPLEWREWVQLSEYLQRAPARYKGQNAAERWTAQDRRLIYHTAIRTAYRKEELRKLRGVNLHLEHEPAYITLPGRHSKNRKASGVPIPADLADELRHHVKEKGIGPNDPVFWITKGRSKTAAKVESEGGVMVKRYAYAGAGGAKGALQRDLRDAGLAEILDIDDQVTDFHTLRATAITWWLEGVTPSGKRLSPEQVRRLARLSSLAMVQKYIRGARYEDHSWLEEPGQRELFGRSSVG